MMIAFFMVVSCLLVCSTQAAVKNVDDGPSIISDDGDIVFNALKAIIFNGTVVQCANATGECFPSMKLAIEAVKTSLEVLIGSVSGDLAALETNVGQLNNSVDGLRGTPNVIHSLDVKSDELSNAIDAVNSDLNVTISTVNELSSILATVTSCLNCGKDKYCDAGECVACSTLCMKGFKQDVPCGFDHDRECVDINECDQKDTCYPGVTCTNTDGGFDCGACPVGFYGNGIACHPCSSCPQGFHAVVDCDGDHDVECDDVDECMAASHECHENATCINAVGGYKCKCSEGYFGDGYNCRRCSACPDGFELDATCEGVFDTVCKDVDECDTDPCLSSEVCVNTYGTYRCDCPDGYFRDSGSCSIDWGADSFLGELINGDSIVSGGKASFKQIESSNGDIFDISNGDILIKEAGLISLDYHQDTRCYSSYCTIILYAITPSLTREISRELIAYTTNWDGIFLSSNFKVEANTLLRVNFASADFRTIDNGIWSRISVGFIPETAKPSSYVGLLNNMLSGNYATFSDAFVDQSELDDITQNGGYFYFGQDGIVKFDYLQDIIHNCGYFYGEAIRYRNTGETIIVSRELQAHTSGRWDGYHDGGAMAVKAGDHLRFNMYIDRCSSRSIDNGVWAPVGIGFIPYHGKNKQATYIGVLTNNCGGSICRFVPRELTNSDVFSLTNGELTVAKAGHVSIDYHQDLIHACPYAYLSIIRVRGSTTDTIVRELQAHTSGYWDGIAVSGNFAVNADDIVRMELQCSAIQAIDNGDWGLVSAVWHPPSH
eukprot:m.35778 g.35778  ORF g.35778 m.35778 type:complete len:776 (+) comp6624_c0_seq2:70-2397(+)